LEPAIILEMTHIGGSRGGYGGWSPP